MKFILAFLLLSCATSAPAETTECNFIPDDNYKGEAILIDTDSSGGPPTQGDVSIANALTTGSGLPFPSIKAICTLTAANPLASPPFCTLETTLADGKIMASGTPPELVVMGGTGMYYRASGMMTTAENFVQENGSISFNARIDFCLPVNGGPNPNPSPSPSPSSIPFPNPNPFPITAPPIPITNCEDDKTWSTTDNKGRKVTCQKVGNNSSKHCRKVAGAKTACPLTCGTCPVFN